MTEDEEYTAQVLDMVRALAAWMDEVQPDDTRLMPALAVVLGRVIARSASNHNGREVLLAHAANAMRNSADEAANPPPIERSKLS